MLSRRNLAAIAALAALFVLAPSIAGAYLDPGSGSYLLQLLIAGLVAAAFTLKMFWGRLKALFTDHLRKRGGGRPEND